MGSECHAQGEREPDDNRLYHSQMKSPYKSVASPGTRYELTPFLFPVLDPKTCLPTLLLPSVDDQSGSII